MTEANLTNKIRLKCKERMGDNGFIWKARGDPRQTRGIPDLVGVYHGIFFFFEVKLPGKERTLTKNQSEVIKRMQRAGGIGGVVTGVPGAIRTLVYIEDLANGD